MHKLNNKGTLNTLLIPFILVFIVLITVTGLATWAYMSRQDYKDNSDKKVATAVDVAKKEEASVKDNEFLEKEKQPLTSYAGPAAYGSVVLKYPKTWSAYILEAQSSNPVDGYLQPGFVPAATVQNNFALRIQVSATSYDQELQQFESTVKAGKATVTPIKLAMVSSVTGVRVDGQITGQKQGSMVLFPMRDKTLKVWTEADQFTSDFNNNILPNLSFSP